MDSKRGAPFASLPAASRRFLLSFMGSVYAGGARGGYRSLLPHLHDPARGVEVTPHPPPTPPTHTPLTHAHCDRRGAPAFGRGDASVVWPLPRHRVCVETLALPSPSSR